MAGAHAQQAMRRPWACQVSKRPLGDDLAQARNKACPCNALMMPYLLQRLVLLNQHWKLDPAAPNKGPPMGSAQWTGRS